MKIEPDWIPSPENINALPDPLRKYIHDLHTNVDPQGLVRQNFILKQEVNALRAELETRKNAAVRTGSGVKFRRSGITRPERD